jgi:CheY-like chemotaxis protein
MIIMRMPLNIIMLIDDNSDDNFFHIREIKKLLPDINLITKLSAVEALDYLKNASEKNSKLPEMIFLDINMPGMNGWEFLKECEDLDKDVLNIVKIIMLSTYDYLPDLEKAKSTPQVTDFIAKPLKKERLEELLVKYFYFDIDHKRWMLK